MEDPDDIAALRLQLATERRRREDAEKQASEEAKKREVAEQQAADAEKQASEEAKKREVAEQQAADAEKKAADEAKKREVAEQQVDHRNSYIGVLQSDNRRLRCDRWDRLRRRSCLSDYRALRHLYSMR